MTGTEFGCRYCEKEKMNGIIIRDINSSEEVKVSGFIEKVFSSQIAPLFTEEGVHEFSSYIRPLAFADRMSTGNNFLLIAETNDENREFAGIIEVRDYSHISLFFVDSDLQRKGVGRLLLKTAIDKCLEKGTREITVHSSPNSVTAYMRFGFIKQGDETEQNGIKYVPMKKEIVPAD